MRGVTGALLAFEGLDQSGKETQARRLAARFAALGREVVPLTFPCDRTPIAHEIRRALAGAHEYPADVLQLLFIANRYEYRSAILDWLAEGRVVICDRYAASSIAYGEAQGLDADWLRDVQRHLPTPDATIFIDIAPSTALGRKAVGRDRFERDLPLLSRVRDSYVRQAASPGWFRVDGEATIDAVEATVLAIIRARPGLLSTP